MGIAAFIAILFIVAGACVLYYVLRVNTHEGPAETYIPVALGCVLIFIGAVIFLLPILLKGGHSWLVLLSSSLL